MDDPFTFQPKNLSFSLFIPKILSFSMSELKEEKPAFLSKRETISPQTLDHELTQFQETNLERLMDEYVKLGSSEEQMTMFLEFEDDLQDNFFLIMTESQQTALIEQLKILGRRQDVRMWQNLQEAAQERQRAAQERQRAAHERQRANEAVERTNAIKHALMIATSKFPEESHLFGCL